MGEELAALKAKYATALGEVVTVRSVPITFNRSGRSYAVKADDATIDVDADGTCDAAVDRIWSDARGVYAPELVAREPSGSGQFDMHDSFDAARDCALFNSPWPTE